MPGGALPSWLSESEGGVKLSVRVTPRASVNSIDGEREGRLLVRVTAAAEDGKANAAVCKLIAKKLRIGKTKLSVAIGVTAREKVLEVSGVSAEEVVDALAS